jgi:hypothetical protein
MRLTRKAEGRQSEEPRSLVKVATLIVGSTGMSSALQRLASVTSLVIKSLESNRAFTGEEQPPLQALI